MSEARMAVQVPVPKVEASTHFWKPQHPQIFPNAQVRRQTGEYASAVTAQLANWAPQLPTSVISELEEATTALRNFDTYASVFLGSSSPELGPMSSILLRTESASSSQIEQLSTSAKQLALSEIDESQKSNARTVIGNVRAMEAALDLSENLTVETILAMHARLMTHQPDMSEEAGKLRNELVWIGGKDDAGPRGSLYIAPQHESVPNALQDLILFINRQDLPVLVQVAVAHAQFESIHPFVDGNGRTGRALAHAMLRNRKITTNTTAPVSAGILKDTKAYFDALTEFRRGDAYPIIEIFIKASIYAAATGEQLVATLAQVITESRTKLSGVRSNSSVFKILPLLIAQPIVNANYLKRILGMNDATAHRALTLLTERGVLKEKTGLSRNRLWQHDQILAELDEYARKIRRDTVH